MNRSAILRDCLKQAIILVSTVDQYIDAVGTGNVQRRVVAEAAFRHAKSEALKQMGRVDLAFERFTHHSKRKAENQKMLDKAFHLFYSIDALELNNSFRYHDALRSLGRFYALYIGYTTSHHHARYNRLALQEMKDERKILYILTRRFFDHNAYYEFNVSHRIV